MRYRRVGGGCIILLLIVLGAGRASAQTGAPAGPALSLEEVLALARERNPRLRAAHAIVDARRARVPSASLPPDPVLQLGVMNLSVPDLSADMPASMAPSIQAMQMLSFPGKLGLSGRIAGQESQVAEAEAEEVWWDVRSAIAIAFYDLYALDRQLGVLRETLRRLEDFERVARAMYGTGGGPQSDVLRAGVETARMRAELTRMEAMRAAAAARLNALLDRPAETPLPSPSLPALPLELPAADTLRAWAEETRPVLRGSRTRVEQAETRAALARRELWPDLSVGVQYGQRPTAMGTERMASAMIGFSLPVFASRRQLRGREEAAAMERMAQAELTEHRAQVDARISELLAGIERTRSLIALYRREVLPQSAANVESALSSYRVGMVDFPTLVDAQTGHDEFQRELHGLVAEYGATVAELERTIGRELPVAGEILAEVR